MDINLKQKGLNQLAQTAGEVSLAALRKEIERIAVALKSDAQYDHIENELLLLKTIAHRLPNESIEIIRALLKELETLELTYEDTEGISKEQLSSYQTSSKLIVSALEILQHLRYAETEAILKLFLDYSLFKEQEISKQALRGIELISTFNLEVFYGDGKHWGGLGMLPQEKLLETINALSRNDRLKYFSVIVTAIEKLLSPTMEKSNWSYDAVTISTSAVPAEQGVLDIREKSLRLLQELYALTDNLNQKKAILNTMHTATRTPHTGKYSDEVYAMVLGNTASVLRFMHSVVASEDLQIVQKIEHDAYFFYRRKGNEEIKNLALEIKAVIDTLAEYQIFKVLIGFEGIFQDWDNDAGQFDFKGVREIRERQARKLAESISADSYGVWKERILYYASIKSDDMATFPLFADFLQHFGESSPSLALKLLDEETDELRYFLMFLLIGLWKTAENEKAKSLVTNWVKENRYIFLITRFFEFNSELDKHLISEISSMSIRAEDTDTLAQLISTISAHYNSENHHYFLSVFVPALKILTKHKNTNWVNVFWYRQNRSEILNALNKSEVQELLDNLYWVNRIEFHAEEILVGIAKVYPELVVEFFCKRIAKEDNAFSERYEAVPFEFYALSEPLSKIPREAVDIALQSYDGDYGMFIFKGGRLLANIFQQMPPEFTDKLIELIQTKDKKNLFFVMSILRNFEGQPFVHELCKELVLAVPEDDDYIVEVDVILQNTGVVSGEYGFVEAYKSKIEEIKPWLGDGREKVRLYAEGYISRMEKRIEYEIKRADENIALRKFRYGAKE